jgi:hypothetical protein
MSRSNDSRVAAHGRRQIFKFGAAAAGAGLPASTARGGVGKDANGGLPPLPAPTPFVVLLTVHPPPRSRQRLIWRCGRARHPASADAQAMSGGQSF